MTSKAQTREDRFIEVDWGFHGVLLGSRALRRTTPEMNLGEVAS
jgi:4-aminobutyrate aminotransferase-like enzyme